MNTPGLVVTVHIVHTLLRNILVSYLCHSSSILPVPNLQVTRLSSDGVSHTSCHGKRSTMQHSVARPGIMERSFQSLGLSPSVSCGRTDNTFRILNAAERSTRWLVRAQQ